MLGWRSSYSPHFQNEFQTAILESICYSNISFNWLSHDSTKALFETIKPGLSELLPSPHIVSNRLLKETVSHLRTTGLSKLKELCSKGASVGLVLDGWENIKREHITGVQLICHFGQTVETLGSFDCGSDHDGLAIAREIEGFIDTICKENITLISVTTDDAGQCSRARRILSLRWGHLVFTFCIAHQVNLLLNEICNNASFESIVTKATSIINHLNKSSAKFLKLARMKMIEIYGKSVSLESPCLTRWNSIHRAICSLLKVKSALQNFAISYDSHRDFPSVCKELRYESFWSALEKAEAELSPFVQMSLKFQQTHTNCADVCLAFFKLYRQLNYSNPNSQLLLLVEKRWEKLEQPLFLLALYLHPSPSYRVVALNLPPNNITGIFSITEIAVHYYTRFFGKQPTFIRTAMNDWLDLDKRFLPNTIDSREFATPTEFWGYLLKSHIPQIVEISRLALSVFSVVVHSSSCESLFSMWGQIHSSGRNRLSHGKVAEVQTIKSAVAQKYRKSNANQPERKLSSSIELPRIQPVDSSEDENIADDFQDELSGSGTTRSLISTEALPEDDPESNITDISDTNPPEDELFDAELFFELLRTYGIDDSDHADSIYHQTFLPHIPSSSSREQPLPLTPDANYPQERNLRSPFCHKQRLSTLNLRTSKPRIAAKVQCSFCTQPARSSCTVCSAPICSKECLLANMVRHSAFHLQDSQTTTSSSTSPISTSSELHNILPNDHSSYTQSFDDRGALSLLIEDDIGLSPPIISSFPN